MGTFYHSKGIKATALNFSIFKTAITLTPATDDRPIKFQILALFFIDGQKINYNYLVIIYFPLADSFGVLAIGRRSADKSADVIFE